MGRKIGCPRCQHAKSWSIRRGKSRCAACHYEWVPRALPLRLSPGGVAATVALVRLGAECRGDCPGEARLERKRVLRALIVVRQAMVRDVPHVFSGVVEVDETYLGGSWRNRRLQSVFRARSGAVEPLSKLSLGSCVEVAWCGRKWYLTWKPRRCCRSCTNACNVAPSSARTPLPATRASQRGLRPPACGPQPGVQRSAREPRQRLGGLLGLSQAVSGNQRGSPPRTAAPLSC